MEDVLRRRIEGVIASAPVVLFMKGKRRLPRCGFSARVVQALDAHVSDYVTVDVLEDPELREGIKAFSEWPTIPQLFVRGEFVGGADIVAELEARGELAALLGAAPAETGAPAPSPTPAVTVSPSAAAALLAAIREDGRAGAAIRVEIDPSFRSGLDVDVARAGDAVVETGGVRLLLDRGSAGRAAGLSIDLVEGPDGGFVLDNPGAPPRVRQMRPPELAARLAAGEPMVLVDVRTPGERDLARIEGSRLLDEALARELEGLPRDTFLVFQCHHGQRSQSAAQHFLGLGFRRVHNLAGGIEAWSREVDPSVPRY